MKVAIVGPDGSGKSTVCKLLASQLPDSEIVYGGKRHFQLKSTAFSFRLWKFMSKFGYVFDFLGCFLIYYPFEYIENIYRFGRQYRFSNVIYDRHPVDRIAKYYEFRLLNSFFGIRSLKLPFLLLFSRIYLYCFLRVDKIYFLDPNAVQVFERSDGQYRSVEHARIRLRSYLKSAKKIGLSERVKVINIDSTTSVDDVVGFIIDDLGF